MTRSELASVLEELVAILRAGDETKAEKPATAAKPTKAGKRVKPQRPAEGDDDGFEDPVEDEDENEDEGEDDEPLTLESCRAALHEVIKSSGPDVGRQILKKFKVKKAADLKDEQFASFVAACEEVSG